MPCAKEMSVTKGSEDELDINSHDWQFIKNSLSQCIASHFISQQEKDQILDFLKTIENPGSKVLGLIAGSRSTNSLILSLLQGSNMQRARSLQKKENFKA